MQVGLSFRLNFMQAFRDLAALFQLDASGPHAQSAVVALRGSPLLQLSDLSSKQVLQKLPFRGETPLLVGTVQRWSSKHHCAFVVATDGHLRLRCCLSRSLVPLHEAVVLLHSWQVMLQDDGRTAVLESNDWQVLLRRQEALFGPFCMERSREFLVMGVALPRKGTPRVLVHGKGWTEPATLNLASGPAKASTAALFPGMIVRTDAPLIAGGRASVRALQVSRKAHTPRPPPAALGLKHLQGRVTAITEACIALDRSSTCVLYAGAPCPCFPPGLRQGSVVLIYNVVEARISAEEEPVGFVPTTWTQFRILEAPTSPFSPPEQLQLSLVQPSARSWALAFACRRAGNLSMVEALSTLARHVRGGLWPMALEAIPPLMSSLLELGNAERCLGETRSPLRNRATAWASRSGRIVSASLRCLGPHHALPAKRQVFAWISLAPEGGHFLLRPKPQSRTAFIVGWTAEPTPDLLRALVYAEEVFISTHVSVLSSWALLSGEDGSEAVPDSASRQDLPATAHAAFSLAAALQLSRGEGVRRPAQQRARSLVGMTTLWIDPVSTTLLRPASPPVAEPDGTVVTVDWPNTRRTAKGELHVTILTCEGSRRATWMTFIGSQSTFLMQSPIPPGSVISKPSDAGPPVRLQPGPLSDSPRGCMPLGWLREDALTLPPLVSELAGTSLAKPPKTRSLGVTSLFDVVGTVVSVHVDASTAPRASRQDQPWRVTVVDSHMNSVAVFVKCLATTPPPAALAPGCTVRITNTQRHVSRYTVQPYAVCTSASDLFILSGPLCGGESFQPRTVRFSTLSELVLGGAKGLNHATTRLRVRRAACLWFSVGPSLHDCKSMWSIVDGTGEAVAFAQGSTSWALAGIPTCRAEWWMTAARDLQAQASCISFSGTLQKNSARLPWIEGRPVDASGHAWSVHLNLNGPKSKRSSPWDAALHHLAGLKVDLDVGVDALSSWLCVEVAVSSQTGRSVQGVDVAAPRESHCEAWVHDLLPLQGARQQYRWTPTVDVIVKQRFKSCLPSEGGDAASLRSLAELRWRIGDWLHLPDEKCERRAFAVPGAPASQARVSLPTARGIRLSALTRKLPELAFDVVAVSAVAQEDSLSDLLQTLRSS